MGRMPQPRVQEQAVGQGPQSHTVPWGREGLGGMRGMAGTLGGQCRFLPRERGRKREGVSGPGPGGFLLVLMPPWFSPLARPPPQYDELPHYPGIVDGTATLAGFSEAVPLALGAPGPFSPHRPPSGLDSDGLKQEKDEIYG